MDYSTLKCILKKHPDEHLVSYGNQGLVSTEFIAVLI